MELLNVSPEEEVGSSEDICRVCRGVSQEERPLFYPCLCTGSIRYVHQDCLVQWLKHSGKQVCELCQHRFEFAPIYRDDMPRKLPAIDLIVGVAGSILENVRHWVHLGFVALMWIFFVPICIYRIYKFLIYDSIWSVIKLPMDMLTLDNIFLDCVYGLLVVLVSLLCFISIVWLKDQLGNGIGPNWLEEDRREVNRVEMREAQERVDLLRRHLEEAGTRARERRSVPDRVTVAAELSSLYDLLKMEIKKITALHAIGIKLDELWKREIEISYDIRLSMVKNYDLLQSAREKRYRGLSDWKKKAIHDSIIKIPTDEELGLTFREQAILLIQDRPQQNLSEDDLLLLNEELSTIRNSQKELIEEYMSHCKKISWLMSYNNNNLPDVSERNTRMEQVREQEESESYETLMADISYEEKAILERISNLKGKIMESAKEESLIIGRQHQEERMRRDIVEARMNRWYNRLLNRHQDDPLILARRQRRNQHRPNIGHALAGLARERNQLDDNGDNVEELTWARLLGLDGSFRFLEHVIWLICLNTALIVGFVYLPFQLGYFASSLLSFWTSLGIVQWTGLISIFFGYCLISLLILGFYYCTGRLQKPKIKNALGITFVSIKVGMILVVEAGIFPLMCGWWIDICSLSFFGSTLKIRQESVSRAPGTTLFLHWLAGMIFIFYLASFVMLLREILRPGVLWFLRNLNDQNFHPINEMINLPMQRHIRRFMMSCVLFGVCVMVVLLFPSKLIPVFSKSFLPFKFSLTSAVSPIREVQIELILLQFIIPTLLEHGNCRAGFKVLIRYWASIASTLLGLKSYLLDKPQTGVRKFLILVLLPLIILLGTLIDVNGNHIREVPFDPNHEGPVYTGRLQVLGPGFAPFKPYVRPNYFYFRVAGFVLYTVTTAVLLSTVFLTVPIYVGRLSLRAIGLLDGPEMYTAFIGLYIMWLVIKVCITLFPHASLGFYTFMTKVGSWMIMLIKCVIAGTVIFVIIPLIMGRLVDSFILSPLRVPSNKIPVFYLSTEWALGLLHTKCVCGLIWLTESEFKHTLDSVYQAGIRDINLKIILLKIAWPVISILSLIIVLPYIFIIGVLQSYGSLSYRQAALAYRYFFPCLLLFLIVISLGFFVYVQCTRFFDHIRNKKYLVGRQLVNFGRISI